MKIHTLNSIYPNELIQEVLEQYGYDMSTIEGRSLYFGECWEKWKDNEIVLPGPQHNLTGSFYQIPQGRFNAQSFSKMHDKVRMLAEENNIREFWDFMIKGNFVRFRDPDDAMYFRLSI